jgi:GMP synthase (glutamine-hydrolysing)
MADNLRFLVIDGYNKEAREELVAGGASMAADQYTRMLKGSTPGGAADIDVLFPADPGASLPKGAELKNYDGIAWTGCSLTVYEDDPRVHTQIEFCREAFRAGVPSFGSCWAAQIAVVAAGGRCAANPRGREMGVARKIALTPEGRSHPLYEGKANVFDAFISHVDEITHLPPGAVLLASNDFTRVQSVSVTYQGGTFWGLQYHPEYDLHEMARLTWCRIPKLMSLGFFRTREDGEDYVNLLETLHQDPSRYDIAWKLGIDADIMNEEVRRTEVRNWINRLVIPTRRK